ncbi:outer membrane lipoprotein chaperone LolA [Psychrobacter sp. FDAARGOS_221]|uniref:outer membrane lipoprotein chaperone LolA n=1 Tax=Psychrobacter sp. FDAARGOS_221 TaxID=1975705 RepID=UPI000BB586DF|nr:outer membrane lipoprotein chaperone LolA [Psychrobacter sp. FDAARGOS_221]PNK61653.1 outer membrane lipoprotein carrier protein LolA [Psychrobacter sp. FDAARGOS_221]
MFNTNTQQQKSTKNKKNTFKNIMGSATVAALMVAVPAMPAMMATQAHAAAASDLTAAKRLNNLLVNTKSMTANFSQSTKGANGGQSGLSAKNGSFTGSMSLKRPNNFRWSITKPFEQLIVTDGSALWVYDKDLEQVTRQDASKQLGNTPALLLSGDPKKIAQNFKITQPNASKNYYVLYPKTNDTNFKSLSISFNGGKPVMMVLSDSLGQVTTIRFSNVKLNTSIANSQFKFTPPKGVDVINQ